MIETMTLQKIEEIVRLVQSVKDVERNDNNITFKFKDKDGDEVTSIVTLINEERASAMLLIPIPTSHIISGMIVSNIYNSQNDVHGTFAYSVNAGDDKCYIVMESHICTRGGVTEENIRQQLRAFLEHINNFENVMIEGIKELGEDSSFMKGSDDGFWENVGNLFGGFWRGYTSV